MFDREKFKEEIESQLKQMPPEKRVAFAVRSAMRMLPLLAGPRKDTRLDDLTKAKQESFGYWEAKDKNKHLLAVLRCYGFCIEYVFAKYYIADAYTFHARAAFAAVAFVDAAIMPAIEDGLAGLRATTARALLEKPLWPVAIPGDWQILLDQFKTDALSLNAGFDVWLDWYDDRLNGEQPIMYLLLLFFACCCSISPKQKKGHGSATNTASPYPPSVSARGTKGLNLTF